MMMMRAVSRYGIRVWFTLSGPHLCLFYRYSPTNLKTVWLLHMIYRILTQTNRNYYRIQSFSYFVTAYYHQTKEKRLTDLRAVKATLLLYSTRVLYHSTSVCRVCRSLSHQYHQSILLYLQTWALWPEVLTYRWEDRCPRAIHRHFCHSCTLDWDVRTS